MDISNLSIFILNIPIGYLLFQRDKFVLHASALEINQKGILFCGFSKSGKSTTLNNMINYGKMISEDVSMLQILDNKINVSRSFPGMKIDMNQKDLISIDTINLIGNRNRVFQKVNAEKFCDKETIVIKKVIILGWDDSESFKKLRGVDVFKSIFPHLFKIPYDQKSKQIFSDAALEKRQLEFFNYFSDIDVFKYLRPKKNKKLYLKNLKEYILQ